MITRSPSVQELTKAFVKFQSELAVVKKGAENPFFKSTYADLASIIVAVREPLKAHGLAFSQFPTGDGGLTTVLMHESGEYMEAEVIIKAVSGKPQDAGSAITYARRYALGAVLGIATEKDDDANGASKKKSDKATKEQLDEIEKLRVEVDMTTAALNARTKEVYGISIPQLNQTQAAGMIAGLKKRIAEKK